MKKPYKEEITGLKIELNKANILLILFFLSEEIFPQIPINGFCQFKSYNIEKGFGSLFTLNYNNDSYTDLVLYNPEQKKILSLAGKANGNFGMKNFSNVPYEITNIHSMIERNRKIKRYAFISRQNMRAGIYSFTSGGRAYLSNVIKLKSYPGNISTADINKNGTDELLVSGSGFDGLSLIYQTNSGLKEKKIIKNISFSNSVFADLSNDGYPDIAAFNVLNNSLSFFYNDGNGKFNKVRSIKFDQPIHSLRSVDMNLDNYTDLLYVKGNSINIIYGDSVSSYNNTISIPTKYYPDQIITGDFNRDGKIDLAYANYKEGILSVIFAKNEFSFYPETIYFKKNELKDIKPYYSKFINGIIALSSNGEIFTITNLPSITDNVNISLGVAPSAISFFDDGNNGINDICYIDNFTTSLNLIIRNNSGIPTLFYTYPLFENHSNIVVDNAEPRIKTFFCFSLNKKLIEILKINFGSNEVAKNVVYSPGPINDLEIKRTGNEFDNILLAYKNNSKVGLGIFEYRDYRYWMTNYSDINEKTYSLNVLSNNEPGLIYWQKHNENTILAKNTFSGGTPNRTLLYTFPFNNVSSIYSFTGDLFNNDRDATISFINTDSNYYVVVSNYKATSLIRKTEVPDFFKINNSDQLFFGETRQNGLKKLFVYFPEKQLLGRIDFINKGRDILFSKLADVDNVDDYFIKKMNFRNYHLVYTDKLTGCITIKQLL